MFASCLHTNLVNQLTFRVITEIILLFDTKYIHTVNIEWFFNVEGFFLVFFRIQFSILTEFLTVYQIQEEVLNGRKNLE